jgi:hypothetical protein
MDVWIGWMNMLDRWVDWLDGLDLSGCHVWDVMDKWNGRLNETGCVVGMD